MVAEKPLADLFGCLRSPVASLPLTFNELILLTSLTSAVLVYLEIVVRVRLAVTEAGADSGPIWLSVACAISK
jgi:hypothetical protein